MISKLPAVFSGKTTPSPSSIMSRLLELLENSFMGAAVDATFAIKLVVFKPNTVAEKMACPLQSAATGRLY